MSGAPEMGVPLGVRPNVSAMSVTAPRAVSLAGHRGLPLAADEFGDPANPPVLLLHGGGQNRHSWAKTATKLADAGYSVTTVDARGHGDSGWCPRGEYDLDHLASDLLHVLERLDRPPAVVGASMGGMTSLLAQGKVTQQLYSSVVLVDVTPRMEVSGVLRIMGFMTANPDGFASLEDAADAIADYNPHRPRSTDLRGLHKVLRERDGRWHWRWDPQFFAGKAELMSGDPTAVEQRMEAMAAELHRVAGLLRVPTLLVRGAQSELVSEESVKEFLHHVPHAGYVDVSGAGHMVAGDDNDTFAGAVTRFLDAHRPT